MKDAKFHVKQTSVNVVLHSLLYEKANYKNTLVACVVACSASSAKAILSSATASRDGAVRTDSGYFTLPGLASLSAMFVMDYEIRKQQLPDYSTWVIAIRPRDPSFLLGDFDRAVSDWLLSDAFTTPMLPSWTPIVGKKLKEMKLIKQLGGFGIDGHVGVATEEQVDQVVCQLVKERKLRFYEPRN